ncbi:hypothetical protein OHA40_21160 [Nocardia sp. NBC_00508]|uniref:hypothetical protein n=1 Tax=Nocardia sp. NBC_00508 TaxID=2975992 RepID=UPI002E8082B5|nr:hypothetical protein [Nocardia sp. NBC_00508]WUD64214.1 hypothetical protein OHA40_21160 [Nocardia sp. NBC_00508]
MFRRFTTYGPATAPQVDDLVAGALPDRVQIAHERLAHQDDPALLEALSERELAASRELAELVRDHERHEQRARIQAAADAAERVRRTAAELAEREAADLLRAAQAIGEQRHSSSPHAKVARLHQRKPRVLGLLAGVVAFSMLFSAVTVQQNIAPTGGMANPMWWLSYGLEALISAVLVALMLSTADTAEWGVIDRLWQVYTVEGVLLTASIALNTFPYFRAGDVAGIGIHMIAPIMIGVALVTHRLVAERYGSAIEQATAAVPDHEDLQERLAALTQVGGAANQILPSILIQPTTAGGAGGHPAGAPEQSADATEDPAVPMPPPAGGREHEQGSTATTAEQSTARAEVAAFSADPAVPAPPFTELWLATTPLPTAQQPTAVNSNGVAAPAGADEAELDARLAAAVRKTLHRIRISEQAEPVEGSAERAPDAPSERANPDPEEAEDEPVASAEVAETHPESNAGDAWEPITVRSAEDRAPSASDNDRAPHLDTLMAAGSIARETADTPVATAPHAAEQPDNRTQNGRRGAMEVQVTPARPDIRMDAPVP